MPFTKPTRQRLRVVVVTGLGGGLIVVGTICLFLSVPGTPTIITGLVVLSLEHAWPKRVLLKIPQWLNRVRGFKPHARTATALWVKGLINKIHNVVRRY